MATLETSAICTIKVENEEIKHTVSGVELDQYIDDHHELRVRVRQVGKATTETDFDDPGTYSSFLGKSISVTIKPTGGLVDESAELEFIGVVTQVSLDHSIDGLNTTLITANSPTVALDGARNNAHYFDQSASDIVGSLVGKYPVTKGKIESTEGRFKFDTQYRETDYQYINRLARSQGKFAYYNGKEFKMTKADSADTVELVWRETVGSFKLGLGTAPHEYTAKVYNYEQKKFYSQDTKSLAAESALSNLIKVSPDASKEIYKNSGFSTSAKVVEDAQSLDKSLKTERNRAVGEMIKCFGQSNVPKVTVGSCVRVKGMDQLDGLYWVKAAKHVFEESGKYHNTFMCTPLDTAYPENRPVETLTQSIEEVSVSPRPKEVTAPPVFTGLHVAEVVDNNDPDKLARIQVKYPWSDSEVTKWVRLAVPHAGDGHGWVSLPEIGDEVLIGYEFGDTDHPIALGALYNKDATPHPDTGGDANDVKVFLTRSGSQILINDKDGSEEIQISMKDGKNQIVMKMSGPEISIQGDGDISITGKNITLDAQQGLNLKSGADMKVEAGANLNMEAKANVKTKGTAMLDIEGAMVTVKGNPIQLN